MDSATWSGQDYVSGTTYRKDPLILASIQDALESSSKTNSLVDNGATADLANPPLMSMGYLKGFAGVQKKITRGENRITGLLDP